MPEKTTAKARTKKSIKSKRAKAPNKGAKPAKESAARAGSRPKSKKKEITRKVAKPPRKKVAIRSESPRDKTPTPTPE